MVLVGTLGPIRLWCTSRLCHSLASKPWVSSFFTSAFLFLPRESEARDVDILKILWAPHGRNMGWNPTEGHV